MSTRKTEKDCPDVITVMKQTVVLLQKKISRHCSCCCGFIAHSWSGPSAPYRLSKAKPAESASLTVTRGNCHWTGLSARGWRRLRP